MNREQIELAYQKFFKEFDINVTTGIVEKNPSLRFATMPYIGSNYFSAKKKILFIGMDIGEDEYNKANRYQSLEDRRRNFADGKNGEEKNFKNFHIAGTYCAALYLLKDVYGWDNIWQDFSKFPTYKQATNKKHHDEGQNPLSFVALTYLFKFVNKGREGRKGAANRYWVNKEKEEELLLNEIELLKPDIVFFQSKDTLWQTSVFGEIIKKNIEIIVTHHPSSYRHSKNPQDYVNSFDTIYKSKKQEIFSDESRRRLEENYSKEFIDSIEYAFSQPGLRLTFREQINLITKHGLKVRKGKIGK